MSNIRGRDIRERIRFNRKNISIFIRTPAYLFEVEMFDTAIYIIEFLDPDKYFTNRK